MSERRPADAVPQQPRSPVDVAQQQPRRPVDVVQQEPRRPVDVVQQEPRRPVDVVQQEPRRPVDVAVGVLLDSEGRFLITSRPEGKVYAGHWEFPGGKIEAGETVAQALQRELHEELGITIGAAQPWKITLHDYAHARVRLHFCKVFDWTARLLLHGVHRRARLLRHRVSRPALTHRRGH
jgi:mutator protein MutT